MCKMASAGIGPEELAAATTAQAQLRELLAREQSRTLALPAPQEPTRQRWWERLLGR